MLRLITTRQPMDAYEDTLVGAYDGANASFSLRKNPVPGTLRIVQSPDGLALVEGIDYTRSGLDLTLVIAPAIGGNLEATYQTNG